MKFVQFYVTVGRRITIDYKLREDGVTLRHLAIDEENGDLIDCLYDFGKTNFVYLQSDIKEILADMALNPRNYSPEVLTDAVFNNSAWNDFHEVATWEEFCTGEYYHDDALRVLKSLQSWMHVTRG